MALIGSRNHVAERLAAFADAGVTTINMTPLAPTPAERVALVSTVKELAADL
jgi:alkanesulfonate monooxygenase SsuD/methylene tetrahydromethanopterin reductase-like flavin-dependent oxidoreductase (luciferase family)